MAKQETWTLDIETSPIIAMVWGTKDQNIANNQILKDWKIIAWSAKKLEAPKNEIIYKDLRKDPDMNDKVIVEPLVKLLDKIDIVITYNGKRFDLPKVAARTILNKIKPNSKVRHFDVWELVAKVAAFTSTKFEYISEHVNKKYKKLTHSKFPGMELWKECLMGNTAAWNEMKLYNIQDTLGTEESALFLKEWAPKAFPDWNDEKCDSCGKIRKVKVKCQDCGKWS